MSTEDRQRAALLLAADTGVDPRTALRWLRGKRVLRSIAGLLAAAAERLGIERPEPRQEAS